MRTFVLLLSCLVCCATAGHYGLAQKLLHLNNVRTGQKGYTSVGTDQRQHQEFLLDVLLQVQKPLVNNQLVQLGQELVTDPNMYLLPNDEILQQFLQQAENREVIGRNGVYNPVDISNIRQLVGLQRFLVLARDFNVFQRNVVYARLYFNAAMFVDALSLAIRDRPDTQDLVLPPMNEILPQLYYDNYVLNYAQNVDYSGLISQEARANIKSSIFDIFGLRRIGSLFQLGNYANYNPLQQRYSAQRYGFGRFGIAPEGRTVNSKESGGEYVVEGSYIQEKIVVPVEGRDGTDLTNDVDLNVAWNNIVIDQLVQAVTEGVEGGQQIGSNGLPQVDVGSPRLLFGGRGRRVDNGGYSVYVNPFYGQQNQYGYNDQEYARQQYQTTQNGYTGPGYSYDRQQNQAGQYYYQDNDYSYGRQQNQGPLYGYKGKEYYYARQQNQGPQYGQQNQGSQYGYNSYGQQNQGSQYGYKDNEYSYGRQQSQGSQYGYNPYGQQNQGSQYGYKDNDYSYGRQQNQGSQYGYNSYGQQSHGSQYGYKDNEYSYGRQQNRGSQYGYNSYGQQNQGSQYGYKGNDYSYGRQQNQGSQYGYNSYGEQQKGSQYGSYYGIPYGRQQYQGSQYGYENQQYYYGGQPSQGAKYSYNYPVYSSTYYNPYGSQQYYYKNYEYQYEPRIQPQDQSQGQQQQQTYRVLPYGPQEVVGDDVVVIERVARETHNRGQSGKRYRSDEGKRVSYRYAEQYRELGGLHASIIRSIETTQQLSYARRGEILLQSIQELAARLNIQRIVETLEGSIYQQQDIQVVQQEVDQITQQIRALVEQIREEAGISEGSERTLHIVADVIGGRIVLEQQQQLSIDVKRTLQELQQQIQRIVGNQVGQVNEVTPLVLLFGSLRSPVTQQTILSLAQLIDDYRQQLQPYTSSQLSGNGDIKVQNVQIDPLVTYTEVVDVDLVNMIDQQLLQSNANNLQQLGQKVVARQQRLNYQPFTISLDIESQHQQEVAIRILLAPQIDYTGRRVSLAQNRNNFILIDAYVQQLQAGVNNIERNSRQFNGYNREVSTISQIYRQIMTGQINVQSGVTRQLPRNLLLPRGSANGGLPVQIMVVVTPLNQQAEAELLHVDARQISGLGIAAVGVDQLPLNYPLDRQIVDGQRLDVPNIQLVETVIQYESRRSA